MTVETEKKGLSNHHEQQEQLNIPLLHVLLQALKERPFLSSTFDQIVEAHVSQSLPLVQLLVQQGLVDASRLMVLSVRYYYTTTMTTTTTKEYKADAIRSILSWLVHTDGSALQASIDGITALHAACDRATAHPRSLLLLRHLLDLGADPNARDFAGQTALHVACRQQCCPVSVVEWLWEAAAAARAEGQIELVHAQEYEQHETALHVACAHGHVHLVEVLLHYAPDVWKVRDEEDRTAFHVACAFGHVDAARKIYQAAVHNDTPTDDSMVNQATKDGWTPLHYASRHGHVDVIHWLLTDAKAQVDTVGRSELMEYECVEELLIVDEMDAKHAKNVLYGETPLHLACQHGHDDVIQLLVQEGKANTQIENDNGKKPVDLMSRRRKLNRILQGKATHINSTEEEEEVSSKMSRASSIVLMLRGH